ncbi:MAG: tRNA1(Val) (adenine(37)-N6)-methyltransferase [Negativicutes bacterium]|nr:tRNA1(Val) (adenine(37)-N6)-methyltransferase [Negativicutes bacterium]
MDAVELYPGERIDDLIINNMKIIQHGRDFCFSLDAVLLAHFASLRPGWSAVDLGTGTGVIAMLLAARGAGRVTGVELDQAAAAMAERSVRLNGLGTKVAIVRGDMRELKHVLPAGVWDLVVCNPPYRPVGQGYLNDNERHAAARHELTASLDDVLAAARYLVKYRGRFAMVHLPERMAEILKAMSLQGIEPKRLRLVQPRRGKKPNMLLVEGVRGARPGLDVLPPLEVYGPDGRYAEEIIAYYSKSE